MNLKIAYKLTVISIIVILAIISWFFTANPFFTIVIAIMGIALNLMPQTKSLIEDYNKAKDAYRYNQKNYQFIKSFFEKKIQHNYTINIDLPQKKKLSCEIYELFIEAFFSNLEDSAKKSFVLITLCHHYHNTKNSIEHNRILDQIPYYADKLLPAGKTIPEKSKIFLVFYNFLIKNQEFFTDIKVLLNRTGLLTEEEYKNLLIDFSQTYHPRYSIIGLLMKEDSGHHREMIQAFMHLIRSGEFEEYGIYKDSIDRINMELASRGIKSSAFLLIGDLLPEALKKYIKKCPGFFVYKCFSNNIPGINRKFFSLYIFKPVEEFDSSEDFYDKKVKPLIKKEGKYSFIKVFPLDFVSSFEKTTSEDKWSKNMHECYQTANFFRTGLRYMETPIANILLEKKVPISKVLSLIPFNIFIPDIVPSERRFILKKYKKIKSKLNVEKIQDWAHRVPEKIAEVILSIGTPEYNSIENEIIWELGEDQLPTEKQIKDRILEISKEVVENANKHVKLFEH